MYLELFLQVLIEPFDGEFDRLLALFAINAVMGDVGNGNILLLRSRHPVVGQFGVVFVVEEFFFFGHDEQRGAVFDFAGFLAGRVMNQLVANGHADQIAHGFDARFGITEFAARAFGRFVVSQLAILFIGLMKNYNAEVYGYLFGSVLSVTEEELFVIGGLSVLVLGLILLFSKELYFIAFDQEMAEASGVPARRMFFLLLTLVALTVVVSLKTVGAILVFAMILIPASTAYQLTHSLKTLTLYSMAIGIATAVGGVMISAVCDLPSGPTIVLLATALFFCAVFLSPKRMNRSSPAHSH